MPSVAGRSRTESGQPFWSEPRSLANFWKSGKFLGQQIPAVSAFPNHARRDTREGAAAQFIGNSSLTLSQTTHHRIKDNSFYLHNIPSLSQLPDALSMSFIFIFFNLWCLYSSALLYSNNIPHNSIGFQPSNLSTKDQRIVSRLSQKRTIVLSTLYTPNSSKRALH